MFAVGVGSSQGACVPRIGRVPKPNLTLLAAWFVTVSLLLSQTHSLTGSGRNGSTI